MNISDFDYELPAERLALAPAAHRDASRLLVLPTEPRPWRDEALARLPELLPARSLVVINDTRVFPARWRGKKASGGAAEVLLVRRLDGGELSAPAGFDFAERWEALAKLGHPKVGTRVVFGGATEAWAEMVIEERLPGGAVVLGAHGRGAADLMTLAERLGEVPLPPYIEAGRKRAGVSPRAPDDRERYQTVYAGPVGAVAAPTAGLHFTPALLDAVRAAGHEVLALTLHVGPGTFRPVEVEDVRAHRMDSERFAIPEATARAVEAARAVGRPIVAVGTTALRALEAAAGGEQGVDRPVSPGAGETRLFVLPGYRFSVVTDLVTNFHLPKSTLLMLVAAFAGRGRILAAYEHALAHGYRFASYGDAMLIAGARSAAP